MARLLVAELPDFMNEGSRGVHVVSFQEFIYSKGFGLILRRGVYDERTSDAVATYQESKKAPNGEGLLVINGNCDLPTREAMLKDGFDFVGMCNDTPGTTEFVQPNGDIHIWTSYGSGHKVVTGIIKNARTEMTPEEREQYTNEMEVEGLFKDDDGFPNRAEKFQEQDDFDPDDEDVDQ